MIAKWSLPDASQRKFKQQPEPACSRTLIDEYMHPTTPPVYPDIGRLGDGRAGSDGGGGGGRITCLGLVPDLQQCS